jgi:excalibur calcium-binding domain-containing protein
VTEVDNCHPASLPRLTERTTPTLAHLPRFDIFRRTRVTWETDVFSWCSKKINAGNDRPGSPRHPRSRRVGRVNSRWLRPSFDGNRDGVKGMPLRPGDTLEFVVTARDPEEAPLQYGIGIARTVIPEQWRAEQQTCGQMTSCAEARFYLTQCGVRSLDGDGNGILCEKLCR